MTDLPDSQDLWRREFPSFLPAWMPPIPPSWVDSSWHNDHGPCFLAGRHTMVWVFPPNDVEWDDWPKEHRSRFEIGPMTWCQEYGSQHPVDDVLGLLATDDWCEVLAFVARRIEEVG